MRTIFFTSSAGINVKRIFYACLGLLLLPLALIGFYLYSAQSTPYGKSQVTGLRDDVQIAFDQSDIPHIDSKSSNDALFSLGYLHARERGWQLEFNRRLASGSLSEILGEKTFKVDQFIRTLGIRTAARHQYELLPSESKLALESYANGINAGFASLGWALPPEFLLVGTKPGLWTPIDSMSWMIMMAFDLGDNWSKEVMRLQLSSILTTEEVWQVLPPYPDDAPATNIDFAKMYKDQGVFQTNSSNAAKLASRYEQWYSYLPQGQDGKGSNNWVLAGEKTTSGKPLLANDPHLGLSSPSTWYIVHLKSKDMNIIGGSIPGLPGVVLGHTPKVAWGFTNTAADVQDLYIDKIEPTNIAKYATPKGPELFKTRRETITIKGKDPQTMIVRETLHGPVISDVFEPLKELIDTEKYVVSMRWSALDKKNHSIHSLLMMNKANSIEDLRKALTDFYAPVQNVVVADVDGNIGFTVAGVVPKRLKNTGMGGVAPVFGWEMKNEWGPYLTTEELPNDFTGNASWIATANHKVEKEHQNYSLTSDWTSPYRFDRINQLIQTTPKHDMNSTIAIQADTLSLAAKPLLPILQESVTAHAEHQKLQPLLENFQGNMRVDDSAALLFNVWVDQLTRLVFQPKLGAFFEDMYHQRNFRESLIQLVNDPETTWCDDPATAPIESCRALSPKALNLALEYLNKRYGTSPSTWKWGQAHLAVGQHRPFSNVSYLKRIFELRAPIPGDTFTVNVGRMNYSNPEEPYTANLAPGMRIIYDLSNFDQSIFMGIGGQSGWVQSNRYREYLQLWSNNNYLPLSTNPTKEKQGTLMLKAK